MEGLRQDCINHINQYKKAIKEIEHDLVTVDNRVFVEDKLREWFITYKTIELNKTKEVSI